MNLKSIKGWSIIFLWAGMLAFIGCPGDEEDVVQEKQKEEIAKKLVSQDKSETKSNISKSDAGTVVDLKLKSDTGSILDKIARSGSRSLVDGRARSGSGSVVEIKEEKAPPLVFVQVNDPEKNMEGSGTPEDPYQVAHPNHLLINAKNAKTQAENTALIERLKKHYQLVKNLDLSGIEDFVPIGTGLVRRRVRRNPFQGTFDGQGNTIKGLTIDRGKEGDVGLFGETGETAVIKNLKLIEVNVKGERSVGVLVGSLQGSVENVEVSGSVSGKNSVGGLIGSLGSPRQDEEEVGTLTGSKSAVVVTGLEVDPVEGCDTSSISFPNEKSHSVGGLVGLQIGGKIENSRATGDVTGYYCGVGGLVGTQLGGTMTSSRFSGAVKGRDKKSGPYIGLEAADEGDEG